MRVAEKEDTDNTDAKVARLLKSIPGPQRDDHDKASRVIPWLQFGLGVGSVIMAIVVSGAASYHEIESNGEALEQIKADVEELGADVAVVEQGMRNNAQAINALSVTRTSDREISGLMLSQLEERFKQTHYDMNVRVIANERRLESQRVDIKEIRRKLSEIEQ